MALPIYPATGLGTDLGLHCLIGPINKRILWKTTVTLNYLNNLSHKMKSLNKT